MTRQEKKSEFAKIGILRAQYFKCTKGLKAIKKADKKLIAYCELNFRAKKMK
jgi:hypothetical protein